MSTAEVAANLVRILEPRDYKVLHALERALDHFEQVKADYIEKVTGLHEDEVAYRLGRLRGMGLIAKGESGYYLVSSGLDAIALNALVQGGYISSFGGNVGVGKEADVFDVLDDRGKMYVLKFYRIGRTSFRNVRRKRKIMSAEENTVWLKACINAAKREAWALSKVYSVGGVVPKFFARERHAILMEKIEGTMLNRVRFLEDPLNGLKEIFRTLKKAYVKAGIINGDLSEYNIMYDGKSYYVIDWPQAVEVGSPNSQYLITRDINNILKFFSRRFKVQYPFEKAFKYITLPYTRF
jgi:RIO kinase 2